MSTDIILIEGLQLEAVIGAYEQERYKKQPLILDLKLYTDVHKAVKSDQIEDALDYAEIVCEVTSLVENSRFHLLETLADHIVQAIFTKFGIKQLELKLKKPQALKNAEAVSVIIERH